MFFEVYQHQMSNTESMQPSTMKLAEHRGGYNMYSLSSVPYLLDQTLLLISRCSRIVAAPPDVLNEIVAALDY